MTIEAGPKLPIWVGGWGMRSMSAFEAARSVQRPPRAVVLDTLDDPGWSLALAGADGESVRRIRRLGTLEGSEARVSEDGREVVTFWRPADLLVALSELVSG